MDLVSATLLLQVSGTNINIDNMKRLYNAINEVPCEESIVCFIKKMDGTTTEEIMEKGSEIISSLAVKVSSNQEQVEEKVEAVKEEALVEEEEEVVIDMFGGDFF